MFNGRRYNSKTELYYYRNRYYSPELGRFINRDPLGIQDNINLYSYVGNNPLNYVDPYGLEKNVLTQKQQIEELTEYMLSDEYLKIVRGPGGKARGKNSDESNRLSRQVGSVKALDALWEKSLELSNNNIDESVESFYEVLSPLSSKTEKRKPRYLSYLKGRDKIYHFIVSFKYEYGEYKYSEGKIGSLYSEALGGTWEIVSFAKDFSFEDTQKDLIANKRGRKFARTLYSDKNILPSDIILGK